MVVRRLQDVHESGERGRKHRRIATGIDTGFGGYSLHRQSRHASGVAGASGAHVPLSGEDDEGEGQGERPDFEMGDAFGAVLDRRHTFVGETAEQSDVAYVFVEVVQLSGQGYEQHRTDKRDRGGQAAAGPATYSGKAIRTRHRRASNAQVSGGDVSTGQDLQDIRGRDSQLHAARESHVGDALPARHNAVEGAKLLLPHTRQTPQSRHESQTPAERRTRHLHHRHRERVEENRSGPGQR